MEQITSLATQQNKPKYNVAFTLPVVWFGVSSVLAIFIVAITLLFSVGTSNTHKTKYSIFSAKPLVLGESIESVTVIDARAERLDQFFSTYNCPLSGMGKSFVENADKNDIPYWLVAAVAFQESSCGKMTPEKNGVESYNAWGWGVYGNQVKMFDSWENGIEVVSEYMADRFYSKGVTDPCEIMKTYTPPSKGSWCDGVNFFKNKMEEYKTQQ